MNKKILLTFITILTLSSINAQNTENDFEQIRSEVSSLKTKVLNNQSSISKNKSDLAAVSRSQKNTSLLVDSLNKQIAILNDSLTLVKTKLSSDINDTNLLVQDKEQSLSSQIKSRTIYGIVAFILLLAVFSLIAFLLRKKLGNSKNTIDEINVLQKKIQSAQKKLEEDSLAIDNKLIDILDRKVNSSASTTSVDHSLALKVADEITRIELNLSRMDSSIKGYKQLSKAVERIKNNFLSKGYEITDMLGKPYNEGMRINADFVIDENLERGTRIITSITKPQVIYNGEIIQKAIVTITQNI